MDSRVHGLRAPDRLAGVDEQAGARDEPRLLVRREVDDGAHDVVRRADLPERDAGEAPLAEVVPRDVGAVQVGFDQPGATAFTRIPWGASSSAICFVSISTPAFDTQ